MSLKTISEDQSSNDNTRPASSKSGDLPVAWDRYWDQSNVVHVAERATFQIYSAGTKGPVIFCLHGGGYTGLTWSLIASQLKHQYRVFAMDLRGHGKTLTEDDLDLSIETLISDLKCILQELKLDVEGDENSVVLVGHSMGGPIVVKTAAEQAISSIKGVVVLDVVEGTALASLPYMKTVLHKRPDSFQDLQSAVDWAVSTKMSRNAEAAAISIPSMLISESEKWKWRTPLLKSEEYWKGWYTGLSSSFLELPVPKLLCLAGTDRLDQFLTVGQMQGKFQLALLPTAGHAIHEDTPDRVSQILSQFIDKFRIGKETLPFLRN